MNRSGQRTQQKGGLDIGAKSFVTAIVIIFILMVLTYILTFIIPGGEYSRIVDASGNTVIDTAAGFKHVEGGIPFWKWILSPILVLGSEGNGSLIAVIAFLLVIGGIFNSLDKSGLMRYMLDKITWHFGENRYKLLAIVSLFFMAMGSFIGSFEEAVPLVPIVVALAIRLGWDALVGLGMSLLCSCIAFLLVTLLFDDRERYFECLKEFSAVVQYITLIPNQIVWWWAMAHSPDLQIAAP